MVGPCPRGQSNGEADVGLGQGSALPAARGPVPEEEHHAAESNSGFFTRPYNVLGFGACVWGPSP
jgi:hypothetical protein